jgi:hypothetical protein
MTQEQSLKIEALKYAIYICESRKTILKSVAYNVACEEIKLILEASIERVGLGENMASYAYTQ